MVAEDAQNKYLLSAAGQELLIAAKQLNGMRKQVRVRLELIVNGQLYEVSYISPSLEGDRLVDGEETPAKGVAL